MLSDSFFDAANHARTTKADLSPTEKDALDQLGRDLGIGQHFSKTFSVMIANKKWCIDCSWPKSTNDLRQHESTIECSLYVPENDGNLTRIPKVTFAYWALNADQTRDMILEVDFMPAHIMGNGNGSGMLPHIKSCPGITGPDLPYDDIRFEQMQNVIRMLKGEELENVPAVSLINAIIQPNRYPS